MAIGFVYDFGKEIAGSSTYVVNKIDRWLARAFR